MSNPIPKRPSLAPRNWIQWIAVVALWLLGWLPPALGRAVVWPLGPLLYYGAKRRRHIAERNLERCFPDWSDQQRKTVARQTFASLARMVAEMSWCYSGPTGRFARMGQVHGLEHLQGAKEQGKGVLMVTGHITCLEVGARILCNHAEFLGVYRPLKSEVMEWYQVYGRLRTVKGVISKRHSMSVVKTLKRGEILWYAPDQDFGTDQSEFAPFFNIQAATLTAVHRLPAMTGCAVVPMFPSYNVKTKRYDVHLLPALENFPSADPINDLARINALIEAHVREHPSQYWWVHRRFKTRPAGEPDFYA